VVNSFVFLSAHSLNTAGFLTCSLLNASIFAGVGLYSIVWFIFTFFDDPCSVVEVVPFLNALSISDCTLSYKAFNFGLLSPKTVFNDSNCAKYPAICGLLLNLLTASDIASLLSSFKRPLSFLQCSYCQRSARSKRTQSNRVWMG